MGNPRIIVDESVRSLRSLGDLENNLNEYSCLMDRAGVLHDYRMGIDKVPREVSSFFFDKIRPAQNNFFFDFLVNFLGEDFRAIMLFANFDMPYFYIRNHNGQEEFVKLGHWDYADLCYASSPIKLDAKRVALKEKGVLNPELVPDWNAFTSNPVDVAGSSMVVAAKTIRLIRWPIMPLSSGLKNIPNEIRFGNYDLAHFNYDYTDGQSAADYSAMLVKNNGFIVAREKYMVNLSDDLKRGIKTIISGPHLDYALYQKCI